MNILLTSVGRRVALVEAFRLALLGKGQVFATDVDPTAPGLYVADHGIVCPPVSDPSYVPFLVDLARRLKVAALVPLIDPELPIVADASRELREVGCEVLTPVASVVRVCSDKYLTARFFQELHIPTPKTVLPQNYSPEFMPPPVVVKPRCGSSGRSVMVCNTSQDIEIACCQVTDPVLQEQLTGAEVTVDVLGDLEGNIIQVVQRKRLKVRAGEVERGMTIRDPQIEEFALRAARVLKPRGCINLQCFLTDDGPVFTEINARFGGGYPLSHAAGADFPALIVSMLNGFSVTPRIGEYEVGLVMMRYDTAVFRRVEELL